MRRCSRMCQTHHHSGNPARQRLSMQILHGRTVSPCSPPRGNAPECKSILSELRAVSSQSNVCDYSDCRSTPDASGVPTRAAEDLLSYPTTSVSMQESECRGVGVPRSSGFFLRSSIFLYSRLGHLVVAPTGTRHVRFRSAADRAPAPSKPLHRARAGLERNSAAPSLLP